MGGGYDETYLQGLRGVVQQTMQQRQLQDAAQERAYARRLQEQGLQRQYQAMDQEQAHRQQQMAFRDRELATKAGLQERLGQQRLDAMRAQAAARGQQAARPPAGYRPTATGLEPIPGGPADTKIQGAFNADTAALEASTNAMNRLAEQVNLVENSKLGRITGIPGVLPNVPGFAGADAEGRLNALKNQVGFSVLNSLKDVSRTGASGLGQVTEKEHAMLQMQLGNLDKAQSEEEIRRVLSDIKKFTDESKGRLRNAYNIKHGEKKPAAQAGGDQRTVVVGGKTFNFPTPAAAAAFKKEAGIE